MAYRPYISIIIPAHNEANRINTCLAAWTDYLWNYSHWPFEIIVVCNGCKDATVNTAFAWADDWPQIDVINLPQAGKGLAVRTGMLTASGQYCYMADVDLSTPANELKLFVDYGASGFDVVIGSRCKPGLVKQSPRRALAGRVFNSLTNPIVPGIHDTQCGFKLFKQAAALNLFHRLSITGYAFDVEILYLAQHMGYKIHELPVHWAEAAGSKVNLVRDSIRMARDIMTIPARVHVGPLQSIHV
jgi:dolichyl-phosphate beta-glucosyltransferase